MENKDIYLRSTFHSPGEPGMAGSRTVSLCDVWLLALVSPAAWMKMLIMYARNGGNTETVGHNLQETGRYTILH